MGWAIRAALPWLGLLLIFLMLITYIPQISLFLPEYIDSTTSANTVNTYHLTRIKRARYSALFYLV
ncbi:MAG: hypothetical protein V7735_25550 [Photobacterium frigidiphilum]|uniref:hypothetical protein n=1 Tax=Photobacterium frigidiphilum TaxID=264736 RepID=UPI0030033A6B